MSQDYADAGRLNRRDFFKTAGAGVTAATVLMTPREAALAREAAEKAALDRIAGNSYPILPLFKRRPNPGGGAGRGAGAAVAPGDNARNPAAGQTGAGRGGGQPNTGGRGSSPDAAPLDQNPNAARPLAVAAAATAARANNLNAQQMKEKYGEITY